MSYVTPQRSGTKVLKTYYTKVTTEGDVERFVGSEVGHRELITISDTAKVTAEADLTSGAITIPRHLVTTNFSYVPASNQLMVFGRRVENTGEGLPAEAGFFLIPDRDVAEDLKEWALVGTLNHSDQVLYYEEVSSNTVRIYNWGVEISGNNAEWIEELLFLTPHTASTATVKERLTVKDQGDNQAINLEGPGDGVLMVSPNGSKYLLRIDDSGNLVVEPR